MNHELSIPGIQPRHISQSGSIQLPHLGDKELEICGRLLIYARALRERHARRPQKLSPDLGQLLISFSLHLEQPGVIIGKLIEVSERNFASEDRVVACHVR